MLCFIFYFIFCTVHWADLSWPTFHYWLYPVWLCMWQINKNLEPWTLRTQDGDLQSGTDRQGPWRSWELRKPWRCRELRRPWWSWELRRPWRSWELWRPWRCRELWRPWQMVFGGLGLGPLGPAPTAGTLTTPPKISLGKWGGIRSPLGLNRQDSTKQDRNALQGQTDRTGQPTGTRSPPGLAWKLRLPLGMTWHQGPSQGPSATASTSATGGQAARMASMATTRGAEGRGGNLGHVSRPGSQDNVRVVRPKHKALFAHRKCLEVPDPLMEVSAVRSAVLADRYPLLTTESSGSQGPLWSPARTIERSQEGLRGSLGGFNLLAPLRNLTMRSCFPRDRPSTASWWAAIAAITLSRWRVTAYAPTFLAGKKALLQSCIFGGLLGEKNTGSRTDSTSVHRLAL